MAIVEDAKQVEEKVTGVAALVAAILSVFGVKLRKGPKVEKIK